ncbi:unnamed protein product [Albugo candida]|uniref:Uncharacterized protein n=1 Tax=Albugo candida TaxID=65357 RepID=A0A024FVJ7_9STRA|nr:unnamed protein product [Albugo candida]|eukprot:CCI10932.1 unnamed protein product [Albugo candida]
MGSIIIKCMNTCHFKLLTLRGLEKLNFTIHRTPILRGFDKVKSPRCVVQAPDSDMFYQIQPNELGSVQAPDSGRVYQFHILPNELGSVQAPELGSVQAPDFGRVYQFQLRQPETPKFQGKNQIQPGKRGLLATVKAYMPQHRLLP